jgi:hypothetical protein
MSHYRPGGKVKGRGLRHQGRVSPNQTHVLAIRYDRLHLPIRFLDVAQQAIVD